MDNEVFAFIIVVVIFIISTLIFAFIYYSYNKDNANENFKSFTYSLYTSITIQAGIGLSNPPNIETKSLQRWVMVQSVIAYLIIIGVVFIAVKVIYRNEENFEKRIEREVGNIKQMVSELCDKSKSKSRYKK
jgi:hypothetical protein